MAMRIILGMVAVSMFLALGCGPAAVGGVYGPYDEGATVVVTKDGAEVLPSNCAPSLPSCISEADAAALCPGGKGPADVVVKDGKVVVAVCYPDLGDGSQTISPNGLAGVKTNGGVITFDPTGNGKDYDGDLTVSGNKNTVYGNGADVTVIRGNAVFNGNNNRLRGATVTGDVSFEGNNVSIVLAVVEKNLVIRGNNAVIADVVVLGDLTVEGNNHVLMRVFVAGKVNVKGKNNQCLESFYFEDKDANGLWNDGEQGEAWTCQ